ncbi:hypothetical protein RDI58_012790 [Solanum bulbocastanum]|uniref:Uncharacterized protein n=1 Tax=Solanum bulbocastanum TaxID=147425 RepID=A0AAN8TSB9_SOLBU
MAVSLEEEEVTHLKPRENGERQN